MVFSGFIYLLVDLLGCEVNLSKLVLTIIYHKVSFRTLFGNNFENPPLNHMIRFSKMADIPPEYRGLGHVFDTLRLSSTLVEEYI